MTVVAIAAGAAYALALTDEGTVVSWGAAPTPPEGLSNVRAIAAGAYHCLALLTSGTVVGWGFTDVPEGLSDVDAIVSGGMICFAVRRDGSFVGWKKKRPHDRWGPSESVAWPAGTVPASISFDGGLAVGLGPGGRVAREKIEPMNDCFTPELPPSWSSSVTAVSAGYSHLLALTASGEVLSWASERYLRTMNLFTPPDVERVSAIAAGGMFSLAVIPDGKVAAWGDNEYGQTEVPAHLNNVTAIAAGFSFGVALTADGEVVAWGRNSEGQTDVPSEIAALRGRTRQGRPLGPLALIADGNPRFLLVDGYPDEETEIKLSGLPGDEETLAFAQEYINLSKYEKHQYDGRRAAACELNNYAARQIALGHPERARDYLDKADRLLYDIPRESSDPYEFLTVRTHIPVTRAAVRFNICLAEMLTGRYDEYARLLPTIEQLLASATKAEPHIPGGSLEKRVDLVRTALQRLEGGSA